MTSLSRFLRFFPQANGILQTARKSFIINPRSGAGEKRAFQILSRQFETILSLNKTRDKKQLAGKRASFPQDYAGSARRCEDKSLLTSPVF